eukprot:TRINITY_DN32850_c0_g1_i1.p1 TRINITY_DN32850_c0_g1~~TRINITY_DN32850_c0_g1_i1.p1  ORF type:complete len:262 (+),score=49.79 TRINITY_DN32850_c0_g1_i1:78-863(+)
MKLSVVLPLLAVAFVASAASVEDASDTTSHVVVLDDSNFEEMTEKHDWLIKFYAPWCGHCKNLAPIWEEVATHYKDDPKRFLGKVDCTNEGRATCQRFNVRGFPTVIRFRNNRMGILGRERSFAEVRDSFVKTELKEEAPLPLSFVGKVKVFLSAADADVTHLWEKQWRGAMFFVLFGIGCGGTVVLLSVIVVLWCCLRSPAAKNNSTAPSATNDATSGRATPTPAAGRASSIAPEPKEETQQSPPKSAGMRKRGGMTREE